MLKDIPHVQGCLINEQHHIENEQHLLENEKRINAIEYYLNLENKTIEPEILPSLEPRINMLELKIPAYEGHAEVLAQEAADMIGAYNAMQSEIVHIREEITEMKKNLKDLNTAILILINKLQ